MLGVSVLERWNCRAEEPRPVGPELSVFNAEHFPLREGRPACAYDAVGAACCSVAAHNV